LETLPISIQYKGLTFKSAITPVIGEQSANPIKYVWIRGRET
jgi:hypothetical protein